MTAAEFFARYAERSGVAPEELAAYGKRAYRCRCGEEGCEGWAMLTAALVDEERASGVVTSYTRGVAPSDVGYAP